MMGDLWRVRSLFLRDFLWERLTRGDLWNFDFSSLLK